MIVLDEPFISAGFPTKVELPTCPGLTQGLAETEPSPSASVPALVSPVKASFRARSLSYCLGFTHTTAPCKKGQCWVFQTCAN
jgi:hypothetical protein